MLAELPFILRIPGRRDDFDESLWSEAMSDEHIDEDEGQSGVYRVLYVDGARWSAWQTSEGVRMLPGAGPLVDVSPWGYLSFCENGSMTSGLDESVFGLATPIAVVSATLLDPLSWGEDTAVVLRRRGKSTVDDAAMFVEWLLDGGLARGYFTEEVPLLQAMLAQLFVEASINNFNGVSVPGSRLAAGAEAPLDFGDADSSEWILKVDLDEDFTKVVLDSLAQRSPRLAEIVTAAREPDSPAGLARRAALEAWSQTFSWADYYDSQEQRQRSSY
ncbi:hypothetical protein A5680_06100 [Mycobacterium sp. E2989]|nr:hypothetical protein A5680_06100 [Mycobacterium sp. E2989]